MWLELAHLTWRRSFPSREMYLSWVPSRAAISRKQDPSGCVLAHIVTRSPIIPRASHILILHHTRRAPLRRISLSAMASDGFLSFVSALFGWVYFLAWSISFYPQGLLNWSRRSTSGTTVDFHFINILGTSSISHSAQPSPAAIPRPSHALLATSPHDMIVGTPLTTCRLGRVRITATPPRRKGSRPIASPYSLRGRHH